MSDITLNPAQLANRVQWVRDLTSGEFQQSQHTLAKRIAKRIATVDGEGFTYGYCCLGVACVRIDPAHGSLTIGHNGGSHGVAMPDTFAAEHYGLHPENDQGAAMGWNDTEHYNFNRIADLIAYATEHSLYFNEVNEVIGNVPEGYAIEWLAQFSDSE